MSSSSHFFHENVQNNLTYNVNKDKLFTS